MFSHGLGVLVSEHVLAYLGHYREDSARFRHASPRARVDHDNKETVLEIWPLGGFVPGSSPSMRTYLGASGSSERRCPNGACVRFDTSVDPQVSLTPSQGVCRNGKVARFAEASCAFPQRCGVGRDPDQTGAVGAPRRVETIPPHVSSPCPFVSPPQA